MLMSSRSSCLCFLLTLLLAGWISLPAHAQPGELQGFSGASLGQSELGQGTKILVFWTSWSPRCRDIFPRLEALQARWGSRAEIVAVNFEEDRGAVAQFIGGAKPGTRIVLDLDGALAKKHGITNLPGLLVLRNGEVAYSGKLPDDPDSLLARLLG